MKKVDECLPQEAYRNVNESQKWIWEDITRLLKELDLFHVIPDDEMIQFEQEVMKTEEEKYPSNLSTGADSYLKKLSFLEIRSMLLDKIIKYGGFSKSLFVDVKKVESKGFSEEFGGKELEDYLEHSNVEDVVLKLVSMGSLAIRSMNNCEELDPYDERVNSYVKDRIIDAHSLIRKMRELMIRELTMHFGIDFSKDSEVVNRLDGQIVRIYKSRLQASDYDDAYKTSIKSLADFIEKYIRKTMIITKFEREKVQPLEKEDGRVAAVEAVIDRVNDSSKTDRAQAVYDALQGANVNNSLPESSGIKISEPETLEENPISIGFTEMIQKYDRLEVIIRRQREIAEELSEIEKKKQELEREFKENDDVIKGGYGAI